jgi:hypothetical protein
MFLHRERGASDRFAQGRMCVDSATGLAAPAKFHDRDDGDQLEAAWERIDAPRMRSVSASATNLTIPSTPLARVRWRGKKFARAP